MIDLRRDLFSRLVISSHKKKYLNKPFRVKHVDAWKASQHVSNVSIESQVMTEEPKSLEENVANVPFKFTKKEINAVETIKPVSIVPTINKVEKIDEKVENLLNDPALIELQIELEFAEQLLKKVKDADAHNPKIPLIEETISRLRILLNQKMYV